MALGLARGSVSVGSAGRRLPGPSRSAPSGPAAGIPLLLRVPGSGSEDICPSKEEFSGLENYPVLTLVGHGPRGPCSHLLVGKVGLCDALLYESFEVNCGLFVLNHFKLLGARGSYRVLRQRLKTHSFLSRSHSPFSSNLQICSFGIGNFDFVL